MDLDDVIGAVIVAAMVAAPFLLGWFLWSAVFVPVTALERILAFAATAFAFVVVAVPTWVVAYAIANGSWW